jgi:non-canonical poly(A) RNA polymerase PAPD5/7
MKFIMSKATNDATTPTNPGDSNKKNIIHHEDNDDGEEKSTSSSCGWKDDDFLTFGQDDSDGSVKSSSSPPSAAAAGDNGVRKGNNQRDATTRTRKPWQPTLSSLTAVTELPPWMDRPHSVKYHRNVPRLVLLHDEIVEFAQLMAPQPEELEIRQRLVEKVTRLVKETFEDSHCCEVKVFGSQATKLLLPTSDIDFVVQLSEEHDDPGNGETSSSISVKEKQGPSDKCSQGLSEKQRQQREMDEYNIQKELKFSPLVRLGEALRHHPDWKGELSYLEVVENTRVPIVKFTHGPTNIDVDICINQEAGLLAADLMKRLLDAMPPLKPLTFVLKYFLAARGLNEPYTGGCGSFMLQLMIVSFLQHRERHSLQHSRDQRYDGVVDTMNLGSMLLEFFELYGMDFNYLTTGISIRSDGFYFPKGAKGKKEHFYHSARPFSLAMENPFEITADVGQTSYRMQLIAKSFETAMRVLLSHTAEPVIHTESILASILPPTQEMFKRATMHKVYKIERQLKRNQSSEISIRDNDGNGKKRKTSLAESSSNMSDSEDSGVIES